MVTPRYPYVLFDWDGCLAMTLDIWMAGFRETFAAYDIDVDDYTIGRQLGDHHGPRELGVDPERLESFWVRLRDGVRKQLPEVQLYPGAKSLIDNLQELGVRIALVSSSGHRELREAMSNNGLSAAFDAVVAGDDVARHKPDPEGLYHALERIGGTADRAVMIGDSTKDLGAANNAGTDSILVFPETHALLYDFADLEAHDPTFVCRSFDDVRDVLLPDLQTAIA